MESDFRARVEVSHTVHAMHPAGGRAARCMEQARTVAGSLSRLSRGFRRPRTLPRRLIEAMQLLRRTPAERLNFDCHGLISEDGR